MRLLTHFLLLFRSHLLIAKRARSSVWLTPVLAILLATPFCAVGQTYQESKQLPLPDEFKDRRSVSKLRQEKNNAVRDGVADASNKKILENFYFGFMFRALTREEYADSAAELRKELLRDIDRADPETRKYLQNIANRGGKGLLKDPRFHPAAHVNAVLLLGEMNQQEGVGNTKAPVPDPEVTKFMAELVASDQHSEPVRVTALQALERHVRLRSVATGSGALTNEERETIRSLAMGIASQMQLPSDRTAEAHELVRIQAVQILGALKDPGTDGQVLKGLEAIVAEPKSGVDLRAAALEAMGAMDATQWEADPAKSVAPIARLLIDVLSVELDEMAGQSGRGRRSPNEPYPNSEMDGSALADPTTKTIRRRLLPRLAQLDRGLNGDSRNGRPGIVAAFGAGPLDTVVAGLKKSQTAASDLASMMDDLGYQLDEVRNGLDEQFPDPTRPQGPGRRGRNR